jgi:hypothetical protein
MMSPSIFATSQGLGEDIIRRGSGNNLSHELSDVFHSLPCVAFSEQVPCLFCRVSSYNCVKGATILEDELNLSVGFLIDGNPLRHIRKFFICYVALHSTCRSW